jgi:hypothetical protein
LRRALAEHELVPTADILLVPRGQEMAKLTRWEPSASDKPDCMCFEATLQCDPGPKCESGVLLAAVEVPPDYPLRAPAFRLRFDRLPAVKATGQGEDQRTGSSTNVLKQMEMEVNAGYTMPDAADSKGLLSGQVSRLLCCLAVHAATLSAAATGMPTLFSARPHRGRDRSYGLQLDSASQQLV